MEFLIEYGLFLAKTLTLIIGVLFLLAGIVALASKQKKAQGNMTVEKLNDEIKEMADTLEEAILGKEEYKQKLKDEKKALKKKEKGTQKEEETRKNIFVLDFDGDIKATGVDYLREEITTILTVAKPTDEVFLRLESSGGMVHAYGLAASQLKRIQQRKIPLTISVDKVAASGGYMMACVAQKIIAAPFAVVGSIGVLGQLPNFNKLLKKHNIDYEQHTAGEFKRTLTLLGENTKEGRQKFVDELESTHELFKHFITENRPSLDIASVATGEHWYGSEALSKGLVDELMTSDDYILQAHESANIFLVQFDAPKNLREKITDWFDCSVESVVTRWWGKLESLKFLK